VDLTNITNQEWKWTHFIIENYGIYHQQGDFLMGTMVIFIIIKNGDSLNSRESENMGYPKQVSQLQSTNKSNKISDSGQVPIYSISKNPVNIAMDMCFPN
jgi:hypothetical protein